MKYQKSKLIKTAKKILAGNQISPNEIDLLLSFEKIEKEITPIKTLQRMAVPLSLIFGFLLAVFSTEFASFSENLPSWTNLSPKLHSGLNYLWNILGEPVEESNILYHLPNIVLYSFGILGLKKLIDLLEKQTWLDKVLSAKEILNESIKSGKLNLKMNKGHSILFVGKGDFIGMQFALNEQSSSKDDISSVVNKSAGTVTISETKPSYTKIWNYYSVDTLYDDLKDVIFRSDGSSCGEYVFFPVKDDQIFLPSEKSFDLSPYKLDILCQDIRTIEKDLNWKTKRILIVGDKFHKSIVHSEDQQRQIKKSEDVISLSSIAKKYKQVSLIDPSDVVLRKIIQIAKGRKIVFRATKEGIKEYKNRFYSRLKKLGYKQNHKQKGILTIGYDLFEDQTEQQTLSRKIDDYYPVVLSKNVKDALLRNGYKKSEFLYVPDLVLETLTKAASKQ
jgi:hypothetical protein